MTIPVSFEKGIITSAPHILLKIDPNQPEKVPAGILNLIRREGKFRITQVDSDDFEIDVTTETVREGQEYGLTLTDRSEQSSVVKQGVIRIHTDDPAQPTIELPAISINPGAISQPLPPN